MKLTKEISLAVLFVVIVSVGAFSQDMTKEEWQRQMTEMTTKRDSLKNVLKALQSDITDLKKQDDDKAAEIKKLSDEIAAMIGNQEAPYSAMLDKIDNVINDLSRLSNQELWARRTEVDTAQSWLDAAKKNSMSAMDKFAKRIQDDQSKLDALKKTIQTTLEAGMAGTTYTVGTWARDRDCLWNIAKKPKIYDNAFLWPKIWQGNRDQIKNPDLIYRGQKLQIPVKGELNKAERAALRSYWSKKKAGSSNP
jgi:nucleoid-associated protein YgaU